VGLWVVQDVRRSGIEDKAQQDILRRVLLAYSQRNKVVGYCQGMNFLCTVLIQQLHDEEWVFWVFAAILENILVPDFYAKAPQLIGFQIGACPACGCSLLCPRARVPDFSCACGPTIPCVSDNNVLLDLMQAQVRSILCKTLSNILEVRVGAEVAPLCFESGGVFPHLSIWVGCSHDGPHPDRRI